MSPQLVDLVRTVRDACLDGIEQVREADEPKIPIGFEDGAGDRYDLLTDDVGLERRLRVQRIVIVLEPVP